MREVETVKKLNTRIVSLSSDDKEIIEKVAVLYCDIWKEPPWEEDFWTVNGVIVDLEEQLARNNSVLMVGINGHGLVGFTWGYEVGIEEASKMCACDMTSFFPGISKLFYIDELAVDSKKRDRGIGLRLSLDCLAEAKKLGLSASFLRTDIQAVAAKAVYLKLGFRDSLIPDPEYRDRTFWFLKEL